MELGYCLSNSGFKGNDFTVRVKKDVKDIKESEMEMLTEYMKRIRRYPR